LQAGGSLKRGEAGGQEYVEGGEEA
jgi:hypothetical protein